MLSFSLLGSPLGLLPGVESANAAAAQTAATGVAPASYAAPSDTGPTLSIGPFVFNQDQINQLSPSSVMTIPVGRLSSTHSDPSYVPPDWAPFLQTVLFQPWAGTDANGNNRRFGNYWFNDSFAGDHLVPISTITGQPPSQPLTADQIAAFQAAADNGTFNPSVTNYIAWQGEPVKQQSYQQWAAALGIQPDQDYFMGMLPLMSTGLTYSDVAGWWNHMPVATFTSPKDNQVYGIWLQLTARGTQTINVKKPTEGWSQSISPWPYPVNGFNAPFDMDMIIASISYASSLQPSDHGWLQYLDPVNWPGYLKAVWNAIVAPISCDIIKGLPPGQAGMTALTKMGWIGTAAAAASLFSQCGVTGLPDCTNPQNALLPACALTQPAVATVVAPWYQTWWGVGLIVMIGVGGFLVIRSHNEPRT